jgi:hypothetical protein
MKLTTKISTILLAALLINCTSGGGSTPGDGSSSPNLNTLQTVTVTNELGEGTVEVNVPAGYSAFQAMALTPVDKQKIHVSRVVAPNGKVLIDDDTTLAVSDAVTYRETVVAVNLPLLYSNITQGSYLVTFQLKKKNESKADPTIVGVELPVTIVLKRDANLSAGALRVNIILVGPVADSIDMRDGFQNAFEIWKQTYGDAGITLDPRWYDWAGNSELPDPESGDAFYEQIANTVRPNAINIVVGNDFKGGNGRENKYSMPAAIPGPATATPWSAIAVSGLNITGSDGKFNYGNPNSNSGSREPGATQTVDDEVRLAAEEMGRSTARYLGLQDVVVFDGSNVTTADLYSDTPSCTSTANCRVSGETAGNLMFPFPVQEYPDSGNNNTQRTYYQRNDLSPQQSAALNRSILVD